MLENFLRWLQYLSVFVLKNDGCYTSIYLRFCLQLEQKTLNFYLHEKCYEQALWWDMKRSLFSVHFATMFYSFRHFLKTIKLQVGAFPAWQAYIKVQTFLQETSEVFLSISRDSNCWNFLSSRIKQVCVYETWSLCLKYIFNL